MSESRFFNSSLITHHSSLFVRIGVKVSFRIKGRDHLMKPISRTAFYCCGVRMLDAESSNPLCGDTYARLFMNEEALKFLEEFKDETGPNLGNVTRHRLIDDHLRQELLDNPALRVIIIGAGFDTRAYRLKGGSWVELDEPQ